MQINAWRLFPIYDWVKYKKLNPFLFSSIPYQKNDKTS
tara:strand:+ start:85 stop:198 length:114 start_codon:yes stop_codon:yes gene_type:complete